MRMVPQAYLQIYLSAWVEGITACSYSSLPSRWRIAPHKPERGSQECSSCNIKQGVCIHPVWGQGQFPIPNTQQKTATGLNFWNQSKHLPTMCLEGVELRQECKLGRLPGWGLWQRVRLGKDFLKSWDLSIPSVPHCCTWMEWRCFWHLWL